MQIDFHHTVTYVVARLAGFSQEDAEIIAYSAQYVDDATDSGLLHFYTNPVEETRPELGPTYSRISSAHKMLDYRNSNELANRRVWLPFHFLPSNDQSPRKKKELISDTEHFFPRLICRPNSIVAQEMVRRCIQEKANIRSAPALSEKIQRRDYIKSLCRLGITMHVYADTWAHQDFAGIMHEINKFTDIRSSDPVNDKRIKQRHGLDDEDISGLRRLLRSMNKTFLDPLTSRVVGRSYPLGHGSALSYPDLPYLKWGYKKPEKYVPFSAEYLDQDKDGFIVRDNSVIFLDAVDHMYHAMHAFKTDHADVDLTDPVAIPHREKFQTLFTQFTDKEPLIRHRKWLDKINSHFFIDESRPGHPDGTLDYLSHDIEQDIWKNEILKHKKTYRSGVISKDLINYFKKQLSEITPAGIELEYHATYKYPDGELFFDSKWKLFHDALTAHRYTVLHEILPHYGICAG